MGKIGYKHSKETKEKMRLINLGKNNPNYGKRGKLSPNYGKKHTKKTKEKMRQKALGRKHSEETKQKNRFSMKEGFRLGKIKSWNKGKKCPQLGKNKKGKTYEELYGFDKANKLKNKISKFHKGKKLSKKTIEKMSGKNSVHWLGGKSFEPYGLEFNKKLRKQIRQRDNFICQECGYTEKQLGYRLSVHHIDYNKQNNNPDNLICLCKSCHIQTNFKREDWENYFKEKKGNYL